ncbi:MAG: hypothetical protein Q4F05_11390 [bacterium]|nr:hypothetical protein [bacterium]
MQYKFTIDGRLPGLNEYIAAMNSNRHKGNEMKQQSQELIIWHLRHQLRGTCINKPINIEYCFCEPNMKRDKDNISGFSHKVIQDALVEARIIANDGWKQIIGFSDSFAVDKNNPRIEVTLTEVE